MEKRTSNWTLGRALELCGVLAFICYLLHDIVGAMYYPGYSALTQAVSDLTAQGAPSLSVARPLSCAYGILALVGTFSVAISERRTYNRLQGLGCIMLLVMHAISFFGYTLFPLSENAFSNAMHIVVTVLVVLTSIATMLLFIIGRYQNNGKILIAGIALVALVAMMAGAIGTNVVPKSVFGLVERLSTYSAVIFTAALGLCSAFGRS